MEEINSAGMNYDLLAGFKHFCPAETSFCKVFDIGNRNLRASDK